ncbi:MAG: hypothetical protein ACRDCA_20480 [Serratia sp. (in: enterobacteria)]|uniref:hypothetical protein n=1 Tax=Serratia sp. (in: enterobacteria) TaxID=616 RepID=UPI003F30A627
MTKNSGNVIDDQNELVTELDRQLNDSINNSQLETVEALSVVMERFFSLYAEDVGHVAEAKFTDPSGEHFRFTLQLTVPPAPQQRH